MRGHHVAILQFHPESRIGQGLDDLAFHLDRVFFGHTTLKGFGGANWSTKRAPVPICSIDEYRARAALASRGRERRRRRARVLAQQRLELAAGDGAAAESRKVARG